MLFDQNNFSNNNCIRCYELIAKSASNYFKNLDFKFFGHANFLHDGRLWFISNQENCSKLFASQFDRLKTEGFGQLQEGVSFPKISQFVNPMVVTQRYKNMSEMFIFDVSAQNSYELYVNHLAVFENFIHYHKEVSKNVIAHVSKYCVATCRKKCLMYKDKSSLSCVEPKKYWLNIHGQEFSVSAKEYSCLKLLAHGYPVSSIANQLKLSARTIETYFDRIKKKLNVVNRDEMVSVYWANKTLKD